MTILESIPKIKFAHSGNFFLIAGPCAIEEEDTAFAIAKEVSGICEQLAIPYIFKASYRKANRSRLDSFSGIGDTAALEIIQRIGQKLQVPSTTDIHTVEEAAIASRYVDVLQIPAFLCRQTDLLAAAAKTGLPVNIKKGQFLSPAAIQFAVQKVRNSGNDRVLVTERGTSFGYRDLIVDYRGIPTMQAFGVPVVLDCTHSLQQPNRESGITGGSPVYIETIAKAGIAAGADGLFIETHPNPSEARSDGANMLQLKRLDSLLRKLVAIRSALNE